MRTLIFLSFNKLIFLFLVFRNNITYLLLEFNNWVSNFSTNLHEAVRDDDHHAEREDGKREYEEFQNVAADIFVHRIDFVLDYIFWEN